MSREEQPFSLRYGHNKAGLEIQLDDISGPLRANLYSIFHEFVFTELASRYKYTDYIDNDLRAFVFRFYIRFRKKPVDEIPYELLSVSAEFKSFFLTYEWYHIYDFLEECIRLLPKFSFSIEQVTRIQAILNEMLASENSGYRLLDGLVIPITSELELEEIESAVADSKEEVGFHLKKAVALISKKPNPDFPNSIKESISALEAQLRLKTGESTLGAALKKLKGNGAVTNAEFLRMVESFYAFTNNKNDGIRHAKVEGGKKAVGFDEAKFFLVVSSAMVNYFKTIE